jgi:GT2 family glycosyltransferase
MPALLPEALSVPEPTAPSVAAPSSSAPRISVVIVVWNAQRYVLECLESFSRHCATVCSEVVIVDNASTDGTPDLVATLYPHFRLIRNAENYGFSRANNIGIAQCTGDYVCLVNSDVAFTSDCISPMLRYLIDHPGVAMVGPRMLNADGHVGRSTMRFPTLWYSFSRALALDAAFPRSRVFGGHLMADFDHNHTMPVEVLNGWFVLVRRSAMQEVGLLDTRFFIYGEDVDWCYRFHQAGHQLVFFADAAAVHYGGSSSSSAPVRFYLEMQRANGQYWRKHHGWLGSRLYLLSLAVHHLGRLAALAFGCALLPAKRSAFASRLRRSSACLGWTLRALFGNDTVSLAQPAPSH